MPSRKVATPAFTVDIGYALDTWDARRARSKQRKPGPSSLGTCRRRLAYQITRQPVDNRRSNRKAIGGTMVHRSALGALVTQYGGYSEVKLEADWIAGSMDWLRFDPLGFPIAFDLKSCGTNVYEFRVSKPIERPVMFQTMTYADMARKGQISIKEKRVAREPIPITDVEIGIYNRDDGRTHVRQIPFDQSIADEARDWHDEVVDRVEADGVQFVPRDQAGPDASFICPGCPFLNACWGPQDETTGERPPLQLADEELLEHIIGYDEWRAIESEAKAKKDLHKAHLKGQEPTKSADGWELGWRGGKSKFITEPDPDAAFALLERAGLPIPVRTVEKRSALSIHVGAPKKDGA